MDDFLAPAEAVASTADDTDWKKLLDTLCDVQYSLETPYNTLQRHSRLVSMHGVQRS